MIPEKPKNTFWTDEQWKAIFLEGTNIIVSAGAGSGKTAVLTERIIQKLKRGISIDSLIVLTFTNAAAFEMKQRVRKKITKEAELDERLKPQISLIDQATITTFDSYSLSLVKKYHYLLNLPPQINIIDSVLLSQKEIEFLEEIFVKYYENENFLNVLDTFTVKDDTKIKNALLEIYHKLDVVCKKTEYFSTYIDTFYQASFIEKQIKIYEELVLKTVQTIFTILEQMEVTDEILTTFVENLKLTFENLRYLDNYKDIAKEVIHLKLPSFPRSKKQDEEEAKELKKYYDKFTLYYKELQELCTYENTEEMMNEILSTKQTAQVFMEILKELDQKLSIYKRENHFFTFSDITRLSIELLETHKDIREYIKNKTSEIMIDEYQDTNDIGDYFISLISNHNVYMVGDVKQSIYKFRNANPTIFMEKYQNYKEHKGGEVIDLNKNFRSREEVLDGINKCFYPIMDKQIGGADYSDNHYLVYGNMAYVDFGTTLQNNQMEIYDYRYQETEYKENFSKDEIEAFIIASDISSKIENHYQVFDMDKKTLRDATFQDFVILLDRKTKFDLFKKIFEYKGIPLSVHKDESFVYSNEIFALKNILKLIYALKYKEMEEFTYAFYSVARSYLFSYDDSLIFHAYTEGTILKEKEFEPLFQKIYFLIDFSEEASLSMLLQEIYRQFSFYEKSILIGNVESTNIKLEYLLSIVSSLEESGMDLKGFIHYLDDIFKNDSDITYSTNKDNKSNTVNIMTIHKSKGLEYSICYFAGLSKPFNRDDLKGHFLFDGNLGLVLPIFQEGIKDTFYKRLLRENLVLEDVSERIRVFYVALTRAKEKIIFVTNLNETEVVSLPKENNIVNSLERLRYKSFQDILLSLKEELKPYTRSISYQVTKDYEQTKIMDFKDYRESTFSFSTIDCTIEKEKIEQMHFSKKSCTMVSPMLLEKGKELHTYLEYIDFKNFFEDCKKYQIPSFIKQKLEKLLQTPFFKEIETSTFYKEYSFIYEQNGIMKTGIIDLLIENKDEFIIVDYKTKEIEKEEYYKQVQGYMNYIKTITNKPVKGYLYSLLDETYTEVFYE